MTVRIRLQRHGAKKRPFYRVVAADQRAPRDGRFIELLGTYDPLQDPPLIRLKKDRVEHWLRVGAKPSDTAQYVITCLEQGAAINLSDEASDRAALDARRAERAATIQSQRDQAQAELKKVAAEAADEKSAEAKAEPKAEADPKAAAAKPKVEEPKAETPKVEEPKVDEPKVEEPKVDEKPEPSEA